MYPFNKRGILMPVKKKVYYTLGYRNEIRERFKTNNKLITACLPILYENPKIYHKKGIAELTDNGKLIFRCRRPTSRELGICLRNYVLSQLTIEQYNSLSDVDIDKITYNGYWKKVT
jgi:hypothetical protein